MMITDHTINSKLLWNLFDHFGPPSKHYPERKMLNYHRSVDDIHSAKAVKILNLFLFLFPLSENAKINAIASLI